ncbi:DUF4305 domain-containing protein [Halalkalibacillus sediminis]|uniref:DUF4305 domain-containing protein n=1 Tax=Halalkalibacillus sediminis TaxID=2018042 RepID=A0A2I0QQB6_9BACI|nr:YdiK family protein [Halalkalibacillus sediminis]PKR76526.1 DUF4305 domain-containing protein [Halalkalibacillus sediminis]
MKISPVFLATIYFLMGIAFTYIAIESATDTIWNLTTIIFMLIATFEFGVAIRMFTIHSLMKKQNGKKKK